jgi:eukaryotic-like serine/threonine-protein kinase
MNATLLPSSVLANRYEIERLLGRGGMATVYLACDRRHDRRVAVKILDSDLSQSMGAERFLREIDIAAKLTHPHILPLHDSGESSGVLFYVMPYIDGESLRDRLRRERQLPVDEALGITCEVATALDYAHRRDILHRDIKPENILLEDGHAILADFGIARALSAAADTGMTATGVTLGTPAYMSPEQASGDPLDGRSDLYSLACVLYEMLAGEPPFTGSTAQTVIAKRLGGPPPRIRTVRPSVPARLDAALFKALDRTPADRFSTVSQFREALTASQQVEPPVGQRAWPRPVLAAASVALIVTALAVGWITRERRFPTTPHLTVAVLPFTNASTNPEHAYLAEGLSDALISDLVRVPGIRVVSRMSVMRYGSGMGGDMDNEARAGGGMGRRMSGGMSFMADPMPGRKSLGEIANELQVDALLQGTVARDGDTVRVTASLTRATPLESIWERSYRRELRELIDVQRELAGAVAAVATGREAMPVEHPDSKRPYDAGAHDAFLKGSYYQAHSRLPQAVESFERAVQLDPTHAPAQAGLARAYYFLGFFGDIPPSVALAGMRRAATAALELDTMMAEAHGQLALVKMLQDWDWMGAEWHFKRALEISPGHAQIRHDYAHFLLGQGRHRESMEQAREAVTLDPVNPMLISCLGWHSLFDGRFDDAARLASDALEMMPDHWAQVVLGWALLGQEKHEAALQAFREALRLKESAFTLASFGHALAVSGRESEARRTLGVLLQRTEDGYVSPYDIATVYAGLGDSDATFRWLRRAAEERSLFIAHVGWDSRFDRVRGDARLADLTARDMRLPAPQFATLTAVDRVGR